MNSAELLWGNKRFQQSANAAFLVFLRKYFGDSVAAKDPTQREGQAIQITNISMLRMNLKKSSCAVLIGSPNQEFLMQFQGLFEALDPKPDFKNVELDLLKSLYQAVDPELKANQINVESQSIIFAQNKMLSAWSRFNSDRSIQFSFQTPKGELKFEIPVFDSKFQSTFIAESFGFPEAARIMVVDDSATSRKLSRHFLTAVGYQFIDECADGQAALAKLKGSRPPFDLVVADWHMPNMTGLELLKNVRADAELRRLPIVLATGERNKDEVATAIKEGAFGYVVKPFESEALLKSIQKAHTIAVALAQKQNAEVKKAS